MAADLPVKAPPIAPPAPAYNWSGFYGGFHFGAGVVDSDVVYVTGTTSFPPGTTASFHQEGLFIGSQIGFNWQFHPNFLVGIEADASAADLYGRHVQPSVVNLGVTAYTDSNIDWMSTATGRLGYVANNWVFYGKGGWGWAHFNSHSNTRNAAGVLTTTTDGDETRGGWLGGVGVEWGFAPNWTVKAEYNYLDLGTDRVTRTVTFTTNPVGLPLGTGLLRDSDTHIQTVKIAFSYLFNWAPRP
jgi:outer membrane immunogenic protein